MNVARHLEELNEAQRRAVLFGLESAGVGLATPPLLIVAGAGTGKTKTLAHRVAELVLRGVAPPRILLLTFSRRAAQEMLRRVERICASATGCEAALVAGFPWAGTFHAVGAQLLRLLAARIGLEPGFTILDRGDAADLMDLVRSEEGLASVDRRFPRKATCLAIYSMVVNTGRPLEAAIGRSHPWCAPYEAELKRLFAAYVAAKQAQAVLDYDDLLLWWERALAVPALAEEVGSMFDAVLVDEYQDTNAIQAAILRALRPDGQGLTVVGDDAQAIYAFRGASVRNILEFPQSFAPPAAIVRLERNYRSTRPILDAANAVMAQAREGFAKDLTAARGRGARPRLVMLRDETAQTLHVVSTVLDGREQGLRLRDQAVLCRSAHHTAALEVELARRRIPYVKYGGLKFLEATHVKDVLAILRWAENPRDRVAAFRTLQLLPGIGPAVARRALGHCAGPHGLGGLAGVAPPPAAAELWPGLVALMGDLAHRAAWPGQIARLRLFYDPLAADLFDHPRPRLADLDQLERIAAGHGSRARFLADLTLDPPEATGEEAGVPLRDEDYLILSTIHSAKGQEWRAVFVLNVVDGCIPSDMATGTAAEIEEERRLLYVAMTRARDRLELLQPLRFYVTGQARHGDRFVQAPRSRFLPPGLLHLLDGAPAPPVGLADALAAGRPLVDVAAGVRAMWD